ncbi:hypothetical protein L195_g053171, partial [Trifolium pratense]
DSAPVLARPTYREIKRQDPTCSNPAQSLDLGLVAAKSNDYNFIHVIKRQVPTGPNPAQSPDPVSIMAKTN